MSKLPFGFDAPEDSAGFLLWQTTMIWQRHIKKALEQYNVSHAQFVIMATLMWFEAHHYNTISQIKECKEGGTMPIEIGERRSDDAIFKNGNWYNTTQISIVNWSKLDKMTVSKSLKKLVQMGFVNRIEHEKDTRAKSVSLTAKGKDMVRTLVPIVEGIDSTFFSKASDQEQKSLVHILAKLTAGITDE